MTNWIRNLTGLIASVSCLAFIAFQVDIGESSKAISNFIRIYLIWGLIALFVGYFFRILRSSILLGAIGSKIPAMKCVAKRFKGNFRLLSNAHLWIPTKKSMETLLKDRD